MAQAHLQADLFYVIQYCIYIFPFYDFLSNIVFSLLHCKNTEIIHKTYTMCVNRPPISLERFLVNSRLLVLGESEVAPALWLWAAAGGRGSLVTAGGSAVLQPSAAWRRAGSCANDTRWRWDFGRDPGSAFHLTFFPIFYSFCLL